MSEDEQHISGSDHEDIAFTVVPERSKAISAEERKLREFTQNENGPNIELYLKEDILTDTHIEEHILERQAIQSVTPSTIKEASAINDTAKAYWNNYDRKLDLLHKYKDTHFPQVEQLIDQWSVRTAKQKRKIKDKYILLEKGDEIISQASQREDLEEKTRYIWKDLWQVARAEWRTNHKSDTQRILALENHKNTKYLEENHSLTCQCVKDSLHSCLQQRYRKSVESTDRSFKKLPHRLKPYFLFHAISEREQNQGEDDDGLEASMVGESFWTAAEKRRFFIALERCGRHQIPEIARRVGTTKTIQEVSVYLNILEQLSKVSPIGEDEDKDNLAASDPNLTAREMSPMFILQEERLADMLIQRLETDSYRKHLELVLGKKYEKPEELFELWNMSSLSRLFVGTDDMTVLISAIVQYYELICHFIHDIITTLYTDMTNEKNKTVTKKRMNRVIAKRRQTWKSLFTENPDARLKNMDVLGVIDRKRLFHAAFSRNKSASFLAKKRQDKWQVKRQKVNHGSENQGNDSTESENQTDEEEEEDNDDMENGDKRGGNDEEINEQQDNISNHEDDTVKDASDTDLSEESDVNEDDRLDGYFYLAVDSESENNPEQDFGNYELQPDQVDDIGGDDEIESEIKRMDKTYEKTLSKKLGFITSS